MLNCQSKPVSSSATPPTASTWFPPAERTEIAPLSRTMHDPIHGRVFDSTPPLVRRRHSGDRFKILHDVADGDPKLVSIDGDA